MNLFTIPPALDPFVVNGIKFYPVAGYNTFSPNSVDIPMYPNPDGTWSPYGTFETVLVQNAATAGFPMSWFDQCLIWNPTTKSGILVERRAVKASLHDGAEWCVLADLVAGQPPPPPSADVVALQDRLASALAKTDTMRAGVLGVIDTLMEIVRK
jgi:hypothetical protein